MRHVLVGQTMQPGMLLAALGISRTTSDTARVAGALTGTAGVTLVGMGPAYAVVTGMYIAAFALSLGVAGAPPARARRQRIRWPISRKASATSGASQTCWGRSPWLSLSTCSRTPSFSACCPTLQRTFMQSGSQAIGLPRGGILDGSARGLAQRGIQPLPAACGAGHAVERRALVCRSHGLRADDDTLRRRSPALRHRLRAELLPYPAAAVMLRSSDESMRGRVMGVRMLAIWGLPLGLLTTGPMIAAVGYLRPPSSMPQWGSRRRLSSATDGATRFGRARRLQTLRTRGPSSPPLPPPPPPISHSHGGG